MRTFKTLANLAVGFGNESEEAFVLAVRTTYRFRQNAPEYTIDGNSVVRTRVGGDSRWIATKGRFAFVSRVDQWAIRDVSEESFSSKISTLLILSRRKGYSGQQVLCESTRTIYRYYFITNNIKADGSRVLTTGRGGDTRWVGVAGPLTYVNKELTEVGDNFVSGDSIIRQKGKGMDSAPVISYAEQSLEGNVNIPDGTNAVSSGVIKIDKDATIKIDGDAVWKIN